MNLIFLQLIAAIPTVSSLAAPNNSAAPRKSFLSILSPNSEQVELRSTLKDKLYQECRANFGRNDGNVRDRIQGVIDELVVLNPTKSTATSPLLMKEWMLEWTSEKEINFFLQNGLSAEITQTLSNGVLENYIPFVKGGGFGVTGEIRPANNDDGSLPCRTEFRFKNAKLDLGKWGVYDFPPVGEGWFDTIYLDDELRIDSNSRDDILICTSK